MNVKEEGDVVGGYTEKSIDIAAPPAKKAFITASEIQDLSRDDLLSRISQMDKYTSSLEEKCESLDRLANTDVDEKLKLQQQESTRRENVLVMRLATKEQEMQELLTQIHELKQSQNPSTSQLKSTLLDPSVNLLFEKMKSELGDNKEKLEQAQNDLSAWKFTPDSVTGKKLMAKCRMLIAENQELGKQLSQGRIAQLEAELALQKKYNEELKSSQDELNEFVLQLDEEVEGMQSTICALQHQLKETKLKYQNSQEEICAIQSRLQGQAITPAGEPEMNIDCKKHTVGITSKSQFESTEHDSKDIKKECDVRDKGRLPGVNASSHVTILTQSNQAKTKHYTPTESNIKNPFYINDLLSPELAETHSNAEWLGTDDVLNREKVGEKDYTKDFETNGQYVHSDDDMSS